MNRLVKKQEDTMGRQLELCEKYEMLCSRLGLEPKNVESVNERVSFLGKILKIHFSDLHGSRSKRIDWQSDQAENGLYKTTWQGIPAPKWGKEVRKFDKNIKFIIQLRIFDNIHLPTNSSIGEDELHYLKLDLHDQHVVLSSELLNKFSVINQRVCSMTVSKILNSLSF